MAVSDLLGVHKEVRGGLVPFEKRRQKAKRKA